MSVSRTSGQSGITLKRRRFLILNRLGAKNILHESKESHDGLGKGARKNMQTEAPAMFADKIEWRCRNIEGKKIVCGCGEKGTSKTCKKAERVQVQKRRLLWMVAARLGRTKRV